MKIERGNNMSKRRSNGEGTIFQDKKNNRWVGQCIIGINDNGKNIRKSVYGKTKKEVVEKLNNLKYQVNNDTYIEKNGILLIKIMYDIREEKYKSNIISSGQYTRLKYTINKIEKSKLGKMKIQDIKKKDIQDFLTSVKNLSDSYIKKIYEQLVQAFNLAEDKKYIAKNLMKDILKPKSIKDVKIVEALELNFQKAFMEYLNKSTLVTECYKNIFLIQLNMGLRIGEVLALKESDIDFDKNILKIRRTLTLDENGNVIVGKKTKTYSGKRDLPIPEYMVEILKEQVTTITNKENLLFYENNTYVRTQNVNDRLKKIFKEKLHENINISTHMLRHTYGTRCIEAGMSAVVLQRLMGHKDIKVTLNTYTSVFNQFKESEIDKVTQYIINKFK